MKISGSSGASPEGEEFGEEPAEGHMILDVRRELVLLHPGLGGPGAPPPSPRCTKKFFDQRPGLSLHHNVRPACDADMKRLARHLAGRAVGLVLGGGGCSLMFFNYCWNIYSIIIDHASTSAAS